MAKRRGNPHWTNPAATVVVGPTVTSFQATVEALGLSPEEFEGSTALKEWVFKNKHQKYVPLELLKVWNFPGE